MRELLRTHSLKLELDDVHAFCRTGDLGTGQGTRRSTAPYGPSFELGSGPGRVEVYTRLRESGRNEALLHFALSGRDAMEVWEAACAFAQAGGDLAECGRWVLRPGRVRMIRYVETTPHFGAADAHYAVYMGMTEDRSGGWVANLQLDVESGRVLEGVLRQRRAAPPGDRGAA